MLPPHLVREAERLAANQLRGKIASLLALTPSVDWTMTWTMGSVRYNVACLVSELSPIAVVLGAPRRRQFRVRQSLASWLVGRSNVLAVVAPA